MATKIIDVTYRFCGQWKDTHEAHLIYDGTTPTDLCPGTEGSGASMVSELVTALKALPALRLRLDEWTHGIREERAEWLRTFLVATQNAQALLDRLKSLTKEESTVTELVTALKALLEDEDEPGVPSWLSHVPYMDGLGCCFCGAEWREPMIHIDCPIAAGEALLLRLKGSGPAR